MASHGAAWLYAAGMNNTGQLGVHKKPPNKTDSEEELQLVDLQAIFGKYHSKVIVSSIACGSAHTLMCVLPMGELFAWGSNSYGQLGKDCEEVNFSFAPIVVSQLQGSTIIGASAGENHSAVVVDDKSVWCWGCNIDGQVGVPRLPSGSLKKPAVCNPVKVSALSGQQVFQVGCGANHTAALCVTGAQFVKQSSDGIFHRLYYGCVYTWGGNRCGQLGHASADPMESRIERIVQPVDGMEDAKIVGIACGHFHMLAVQEDGGLWAWGFGEDGRLGIGSTITQPVPVRIPAVPHLSSKIVQIHCGGAHSLALTDDGTLLAWGRGKEGQLGHGDTKSRSKPAVVKHFSESGKVVVQASAGNISTGALTRQGRIYTWGCTRHGESALLPKVAKGMLSAEGHSVYCGYHTMFMVMKSFVKTAQLDYTLQKEWEEEMQLYDENMAKVEERKQHQLELMITPRDRMRRGRPQRKFHASTPRICQKQISSAPVTARILSLESPRAPHPAAGTPEALSRRAGRVRGAQTARGLMPAPGRRAHPREVRTASAATAGGFELPQPQDADGRPWTTEPTSMQRDQAGSRAGGAYDMDALLSSATGKGHAVEGRSSIRRFLKATGATQNMDFQQRWAGLMQAEFGAADMFADNMPSGQTEMFTEGDLLEIGRKTRQFR